MSLNAQRNTASAKIALGLVFVLVALLSRFLPHPPNFTAIGALALFAPALFAGVRIPKAFAILLPLSVLFLSDLVIGFYPGLTFVYLGFAVLAVMGFALKPQRSWGRALVAAPAASLVFFLLSNFGVWLTAGLYAKTLAGLTECYLMALPFIGNQLLGDLTFVLGFAAALRLLRVGTAMVTQREATIALAQSVLTSQRRG